MFKQEGSLAADIRLATGAEDFSASDALISAVPLGYVSQPRFLNYFPF